MRHAPFPPLWTAVPPLRGGTIPPPTEKLKMKPCYGGGGRAAQGDNLY